MFINWKTVKMTQQQFSPLFVFIAKVWIEADKIPGSSVRLSDAIRATEMKEKKEKFVLTIRGVSPLTRKLRDNVPTI